MKIYSIVFLVILSFRAPAQKKLKLGFGIVDINIERITHLKFYADTLSASPIKAVTIARNPQGDYSIKKSTMAWLMPEAIALDYFVFSMRVDTVTGNWYKVYVDNNNSTTLWLKKGAGEKFVRWPVFLMRTTSIVKADVDLEIKTRPNEQSKTIRHILSTDIFKALEIKGDWMHIKTNTDMDDKCSHIIKSGWIRWRINNCLTVDYTILC